MSTTALAAEPAWESLFNGQDLTGWHVSSVEKDRSKTYWTVQDGAIECNSLKDGDHDYVWLMTDRTYADFELELEFQAFRNSPGNSGVQVRSQYDTDPGAPRKGWLDGPQVDIHPRGPWRTGYIYDETRGVRHWIAPELPGSGMKQRPVPEGWSFVFADEGTGWNRLRIVCRGTRITTELNGVQIVDYDGTGILDDEAHRVHQVGLDGHIALQLHSGDKLRIRFRNLRIRPVKGSGD